MASLLQFQDGDGLVPMVQISSDFYKLPAVERASILSRLRDWCNIQLMDRLVLLGALDSMATALTEHKHVWTEAEKAAYEQAVNMLGEKVKEVKV